MDVGLNNRNTLGEVAPELADVCFLVEASSTEKMNLWEEWSEDSFTNIESISERNFERISSILQNYESLLRMVTILNGQAKNNESARVDWKEVSMGLMRTIGHIKSGKEKLPVCVEFSFAIIEGKKVCFYNCCSRAVDHSMVKDWLIERFQLTHDKYTRWSHVNAGNFHNCINSLDNLDKEPRDTKYKK